MARLIDQRIKALERAQAHLYHTYISLDYETLKAKDREATQWLKNNLDSKQWPLAKARYNILVRALNDKAEQLNTQAATPFS